MYKDAKESELYQKSQEIQEEVSIFIFLTKHSQPL